MYALHKSKLKVEDEEVNHGLVLNLRIYIFP